MTNGATIDSIERVLTGEEELPERTSNTLILAAVRANYQKLEGICTKHEADMTALQARQESQQNEINEIKRRSDRWDVVNTLAATIAGALTALSGRL